MFYILARGPLIGTKYKQNLSAMGAGSIYDLYNRPLLTYTAVNEDQLEKLLGNTGDSVELLHKRIFLYLKPIEKGGHYLPLLSLKYDFSGNEPEIRLRIALFCLHEDNPKAIGFRFETPEPDSSGHNYCHVQQITGFDKDTPHFQLPYEVWVPIDQPAICLDAHKPVSLLVSLLVSLYGFTYIEELLHNELRKMIEPYIKDTFWRSRNPALQ